MRQLRRGLGVSLALLLPACVLAGEVGEVGALRLIRARLIERTYVTVTGQFGLRYSSTEPEPAWVTGSTERIALYFVDDDDRIDLLPRRAYQVTLDGLKTDLKPVFSSTAAVAFHREELAIGVHQLRVEELGEGGAAIRYDGEILVSGRGPLTLRIRGCATPGGCRTILDENGRILFGKR